MNKEEIYCLLILEMDDAEIYESFLKFIACNGFSLNYLSEEEFATLVELYLEENQSLKESSKEAILDLCKKING